MMERQTLTPTEWKLMESLWDESPRTGRGATEYLAKHAGWSRSTTLTMLRRMTEKGCVRCEERDGIKVYSPRIPREQAVVREAGAFIDRVCKGSVSMMMTAITKRQKLTDDEIEALYAILEQARETTND